jgi:hypothetical protein
MAEHNRKDSLAKIVKFNKRNPDEYESVGELIKGEAAAIKKTRELRAEEPEKDKYGYYWQWVDRTAAMEADAKAEGLDLDRKKRKNKNKKTD